MYHDPLLSNVLSRLQRDFSNCFISLFTEDQLESNRNSLQHILSRPPHQAPLRLQKMMLTLQRYDLKIKYLPGVGFSVADVLSWSCLSKTTETLIQDLEADDFLLTTHLPILPKKCAELQQAKAADPVMQASSSIIHQGSRYQMLFANTGTKGMNYYLLMVPYLERNGSLFLRVWKGIVKCKKRAWDILFWPGMSSQFQRE